MNMKTQTKQLVTLLIILAASLYINNNVRAETTEMLESNCYFCSSGTCMDQTGGSGWTLCRDASPGGEICGLGNQPCCVGTGLCEN